MDTWDYGSSQVSLSQKEQPLSIKAESPFTRRVPQNEKIITSRRNSIDPSYEVQRETYQGKATGSRIKKDKILPEIEVTGQNRLET